MKSYGFDTVYLQPCMVPHWERGKNDAVSFKVPGQKKATTLSSLALGGSIASPANGVEAELMIVQTFDELKKLGRKGVEGKIVLFNRPMDAGLSSTFSAYGGAVSQRSMGAIEAGKLGAIGVLVRSMTTATDNHAHTGMMRYLDSVPKIPSMAISTKDADLLAKSHGKNPDLKVMIVCQAKNFPDKLSYNVIGELFGKTRKEVSMVVGHLDSWDVGEGAHDDGAGCVQAMDAVRLLKSVGYKPNTTLRAVLMMNEESGLKGAFAYADSCENQGLKHRIAIESDGGGHSPYGIELGGSGKLFEAMQMQSATLKKHRLFEVEAGNGGADTYPLTLKNKACPTAQILVDPHRYFDYHHTKADVFEAVHERELKMGAAAMAVYLYIADQTAE